MFVDYRGSILGIIAWQWRPMLLFTVLSTVVVLGESYVPLWVLEMTHMPPFPLTVVGAAIGIFVSFRTNAAYDRWWEGRKLWGRLINSSRHWATQVLTYLQGGEDGFSELQQRLVRRHVLYVHVLRCLLRKQDPWEDDDVKAFVPEGELELYRGQSNATHAILQKQSEDLVAETNAERLDPFRLQSMDRTVMDFLNIQGGCERIKKTPFPRGYGFIAERLIWIFGIILPLGLVEAMGWATIPMTVLILMSLFLIGEVGRVLEDPFTMFWPALPLSALSKTIEINLRDRLRETNLPPMPKPDKKGILM